MNIIDRRTFILARLSRYEAAYKETLKLLKNIDIVNVNSALYVTAQLYKQRIRELREELRNT